MKKTLLTFIICLTSVLMGACSTSEKVVVTEMQSKTDTVEETNTVIPEKKTNEETTSKETAKISQDSSILDSSTTYQGLEVFANTTNSHSVELKFVNDSDRGYSIGWVQGGTVTLVTTDGQFYYSIGRSMQIPPGSSFTETCYFDTATGDFLSVSVDSILKLSSTGLPENAGQNAATITINFQ